MYRKINIRQLSVVFAVLLAVVVLVEWLDSRKGTRTFKNDLVEVNTEEITAIEIFPKVAAGEKIRLFLENGQWMVESGEEKYMADGNMAGSLLNDLNQATPESVVAVSKDRWKNFEVTDSLGTRVKLFKNSELAAEVIIGKFTFTQQRKMTSYVRLAGEKEVYGIDGMLGMAFNRNLNSFRSRLVTRSASSNWKRLTYSYPADSSFTLEKTAGKWTMDGQPADSAAVAGYLNDIQNLTDGRFAENKPAMPATHLLLIEGDNQMEPIEIKGYYQDEENFLLESSQNRGNFFNSPELAEKIFVSRTGFLQ
ncbi:MAG: DUF4340 domain-containing protein [Bacteroidales bacterium]|nr:DUF4340 domain-containing protein [Bacteroidales bacterium]